MHLRMPTVDVRALFGGRRVVCLDVETDARYSPLGVGRLVCMSYSFDGEHAHLVDADTAVDLFRDWICDDDLLLFGQSLYSDLAVLAQASYRKATGKDCTPGTGWSYELVHRAYDRGRIVDTEIGTRLTHIRFGPHKASPALGATVKELFGIDVSDSKSLPKGDKDAVNALLAAATEWSEWPRELFDRVPWRFKYGSLLGIPIEQWPPEAREYAEDDVLWPWRVRDAQLGKWRAAGRDAIPDEQRQTVAAWHLHLLAIPGWVADRERARNLRALYSKLVAQVERTLVASGIVHVTEPVLRIDENAVREAIFAALGHAAPLPDGYAEKTPDPTPEQVRAHCSTSIKSVKLAVQSLGIVWPFDSKGAFRASAQLQLPAVLEDAKAKRSRRSPPPSLPSQWPPLLALALYKHADALPPFLAARALSEVQDAGFLRWTDEVRTTKKEHVQTRVFAALGEHAPLTKTAALAVKRSRLPPTIEEIQANASTDKKAVREAIIALGGFPVDVVDAVERADLAPQQFDAWLAESKAPELNAYALHSLSKKIISAFLDKLDTPNRVRTTYQACIESGRVASRAINVQQFPRDAKKPSHLHIRGCICPDPEDVFIVADYSQLELCTLSYILTQTVRWYARDPGRKVYAQRLLGIPISDDYVSTLQAAINDGRDCHLLMGGVLIGKSYEYMHAVYERAEAKKKAKQPLTDDEVEVCEARQLAKACNFGFPGGLGEAKFIDYAAAYGVKITLDQARIAKQAYLRAWIEMKLYFAYVAEKCDHAPPNEAVFRQMGSNRERGGCNFTSGSNTMFQGLAADGAKEALACLIHACYRDVASPLYGCRPSGFVHDEFLVSAPRRILTDCLPNGTPRALAEVERLMAEAMNRWIPGVRVQAPGKIMHNRWSK